ncbi:hypothetical protein [Geminicoccus roseus]|uniref:hypothetical protein n=1 Tax=Geminicoccus roseus TaxID=404900 RepID=UPI0003FD83C4|nr:hypothetical protein [Geminicoccus roseus]
MADWRIVSEGTEQSLAAEAGYQIWSTLEDQLFATPATSLDDIRLKLAFYRQEDPPEAGGWLDGLFSDIERMLAGEVA